MTKRAKRCRHPKGKLRHWLLPVDEDGDNCIQDVGTQRFFHLYWCSRCGSIRTREGWVHPATWPQECTGITGGVKLGPIQVLTDGSVATKSCPF